MLWSETIYKLTCDQCKRELRDEKLWVPWEFYSRSSITKEATAQGWFQHGKEWACPECQKDVPE